MDVYHTRSSEGKVVSPNMDVYHTRSSEGLSAKFRTGRRGKQPLSEHRDSDRKHTAGERGREKGPAIKRQHWPPDEISDEEIISVYVLRADMLNINAVAAGRHGKLPKRANVTDKLPTRPDRTHKKGLNEDKASLEKTGFCLNTQQQKILQQEEKLLLLVGPPGTGKTHTLIAMVNKWSCTDNTVVILLSTWPGSRAASHLIKNRVKAATGKEVEVVHCVLYERAVDNVVKRLGKLAQDKRLLVVADEVLDGPAFEKLCVGLSKAVDDVRVLAATSRHPNDLKTMAVVKLTEPFRYRKAPHILSLLKEAEFFKNGSTEEYTDSESASSTSSDARPDDTLYHKGKSHGDSEPKDCETCGRKIAETLERLGVGRDDGANSYNHQDVLVLLRKDSALWDAEADGQSSGTQPAMGLVQGLRSRFPVRVVGQDDDISVAETAEENKVIVTTELLSRGLERKIVVWVGVGEGDYYDVYDKYYATSRATEKVVWVKAPYFMDIDDAVKRRNADTDSDKSDDESDDDNNVLDG